MIFKIKDCLVSSDIFTECFSCDFEKCKGCCCVIGDSGAPLESGEPALLKKEFKNYKKYLSGESVKTIDTQGFSVIDIDGDIVTPLNPGREECAFSFTDEKGFTLCAVEKYWCENHKRSKKSSFRKPISCWLYPIRVSRLSNGLYALNLSREHLCIEAFAKGKKEGVPVFKYLKDPLIFRFGADFYSALEVASTSFFARP